MPLFHIVILALIQGITEFLPVSSSGHLVLAHHGLGARADDMTLDIAVHVGTLFAVLLYFHRDIVKMLCGMTHIRDGIRQNDGLKLLLTIIIGSVPVIAAGFLIHLSGPDWTRSLYLTAWCTLIFGIVLGIADRLPHTDRTLEQITYKDALLIGLAQMLALIPGVSRSGITMTAARFLGFNRADCARYSLLLALVAISGAGTLGGLDLWQSGDLALSVDALIAAGLAFLSGLLAIFLMMKWLERASFKPFVIYRIVLGLLLLGLLYGGVIAP
ncbi:MAG: undecaprenyl-diphosphate phosphatase [Rhodospirillales bacterium]|nr:undecaprenyl-diphosphate phosphatase [Rhodospirillales bacterium]MCB9996159.1 undecaprenyl-diphosphate phosphatase [Rhodospirillales bacterium]